MIKKLRYILLILSGTLLFAQSAIVLPESFRAAFKQTVTNDKKRQIIYLGKVIFSSPDHFKWQYTSPTKKEVCTDGNNLLVVDHDLEQVSGYRMEEGLDLPSILRHAKPHRKSVYIAKYQDRYYTIQVNSRKELSRIAYRDNLDNNVLIVFSRMKYGKKKIPETEMTCTYPKQYDRIGV